MRFACWITKATDTHSEYVILLFDGNNGYSNAPQCHVIVRCLSCSYLQTCSLTRHSARTRSECHLINLQHVSTNTDHQQEDIYSSQLYRKGSHNFKHHMYSYTVRTAIQYVQLYSMYSYTVSFVTIHSYLSETFKNSLRHFISLSLSVIYSTNT